MGTPILLNVRFGAVLLALTLSASVVSAQSDAEGAGALDAPPASPLSEDTPPASTPTAEPPSAADPSGAAIPPPPAPTAGYGTPVYPGPQSGVPGAGATADSGLRLPSNLATRIRVLDSSLQVLAARGSNRIVDGVLSMVTGGVSVGLGIWAIKDGRRPLGRYFLVLGSVSVIRGVLDLALTPNPRTPAIKFGHMPMRTVDEARARLRFGENALEALARRTRAVRLTDASLSIVGGVAVVPLFLAGKDYKFTEPLDYFIVIAAGISVITGIINLISRSDAERRWDAYEELRDRLEDEEELGTTARREDDGPRLLGAGVAPVRGGATAGIAVGF